MTETVAGRRWLITGCSSGFGQQLATALLERGACVIATARSAAAIAGLRDQWPRSSLTLTLDVTNHAQIVQVVRHAEETFGGIDVLVNNAGYALTGGIEEISPSEFRPLFETNLFGAIAMMQAVLPGMRARRSGHIVNISSMGGITAGVGMGFYGATKFALAAVSEALAQEVSSLGIKVTIVEPGGHKTRAVAKMVQAKKVIGDYADTVGVHRDFMRRVAGHEPGDPRLAARAIIGAIESDHPPLHLPLGRDAWERAHKKIILMQAELASWEQVILSTTA